MKDMVWSASCSSWCKYILRSQLLIILNEATVTNEAKDKSSSGSVIVPWPGTMLHYYAATECVRWEHFDIEFSHEDFCFTSFGNGITTEGFKPTSLPWLTL